MPAYPNPPTSASPANAGPLSALHSLREPHAIQAETAIGALGAGWALERRLSCDGHLLLVISQADVDGPYFVLHGSPRGVHLDVIDADRYQILGRFDCVRSAVHTIAGRLNGLHRGSMTPEAA